MNSTIAPPADPDVVNDYILGWPGDNISSCLEYAAQLRGVKNQRVWMPKFKGEPNRLWLQITIGKRVYTYSNGLLRVKRKGRLRSYWQHINHQLASFTIDKEAVKHYLRERGYSVPNGQIFLATEIEEALEFSRQLSGSVCIKPNKGCDGQCVFTPIRDEKTFRTAFEFAAASFPQIIVEEHIEGEAYRFLYVKPHIVGVASNQLPCVFGDGQHTVAELIEFKNQVRAKRELAGHSPIVLDDILLRYIGTQNIALTDVLEADRYLALKPVASSHYGGECRTCNETVHPSYSNLLEEISATMPDLKLAAYDIIIYDAQTPATPDNYKILEMNSAPGLMKFYFPWEGETQDVCSVMIDRMVSGEW